jgi:AraC-like DNA-binding protein
MNAPVKVLIDSDLIEESVLNRDSDIHQHTRELWEIINGSSGLESCITSRCFNKICDLIELSPNVDLLASHLGNIFTICRSTPQIFHNARQYASKIEPAIELECGLKKGVNAIITEEPEKYVKDILPIWSVDDLSIRLSLNSIYARSSYEPQKQLSFSLCVESDSSKYMFRNTIRIITKTLGMLKAVGFDGLTQIDLASNLQLSDKTAQSIIWDLSNFSMASYSRNRVVINQDLLDTGTEDISKHLSIVLKEHIIVQEIYKEIKLNQCITQWKLQEIIAQVHTCSKQLKDKILRDYRSRFISWLLFAKLLEKRRNNTFVIPVDENIQKINSQNKMPQQLDFLKDMSPYLV